MVTFVSGMGGMVAVSPEELCKGSFVLGKPIERVDLKWGMLGWGVYQ